MAFRFQRLDLQFSFWMQYQDYKESVYEEIRLRTILEEAGEDQSIYWPMLTHKLNELLFYYQTLNGNLWESPLEQLEQFYKEIYWNDIKKERGKDHWENKEFKNYYF